MSAPHDSASLFLFVPADRPERFEKAAAAGADAVIVDLEDAVAPSAKDDARASLAAGLTGFPPDARVFIRINGIGTPWHAQDLALAARLPIAGVVLPKAERAGDVDGIRSGLAGKALIALVETAAGLVEADAIARASDRLAFGSVDFAADLGCAHIRDALLPARSRLVLAARLAGQSPPLDGVTLSIKDEAAVEGDARYAASLGLGGKLLIHPAQVAPARRGLAPDEQDIAWAERIVAGSADGAARAVDGMMVDAPVLARARHILERRDRPTNGQKQ
jgi:citrate lyase subunit beta/citryl-CoA lyase